MHNLVIDSAFPGGNIVVESIDGDDVFLHQDLRDTDGHWFYWYFRVRGAAGRTLTFHFTRGDVVSTLGPSFSLDCGKTWNWLGREACQGTSFVFCFEHEYDEVRFCVTVPYLETDLGRFLANYKGNPSLKQGILCRTAKGREVEFLELGCLHAEPSHRVLLTSRHHCCETMANYVMEGVLEEILAENPLGMWLRQNVHFLVVPFMDKDGVEDGDQGKNRRPHDHNRDYGYNSIHPSVRALKAFASSWSQGKLQVAFDLHCPELKGDWAEFVYSPGSSDPRIWDRQQQFSRILEDVNDGPIPFEAKNNLPHGVGWNTRQPCETVKSFAEWASSLIGMYLAMTIETPYAWSGGVPVTKESARGFGKNLAHALKILLEQIGPV